MPSKTTKGASSKAHIRASSASSAGKLNVSAAFVRNKSSDKLKRNTSDLQHHVARNPSPYPNPPHVRGNLSPTKRALVLKVDTAGDDDEWVSSESGAATPAEYDEEDVPPSLESHVRQEEHDPIPSTTPRGDASPLPVVPPHRPRPPPQTHSDLPRVDTVTKFTTQAEDSPSSGSATHDPPTPTRRAGHRRPATRPPSMRSTHSGLPHPLIRARSYAPSTPVITALSPGLAQVYPVSTSSSPSSPPMGPSSESARSPESETNRPYLPRLRRQGSHSSVTSVATLPLPTTSSAATASTTRVHGERQRTLSHASTSAALSSLTAARSHHAPSRPASPVLPIAFPPINPHEEQVHVMIPPPLVPPHVSATAHQNPILQALQRVAEAKARAGR
ncbi:hypothetical protein JB92DRAFT_2986953 [Gautieria morchelliformis]|nr:hypothetical protein JB92DRAFT_2986953 [Gautieria morchelliformis]